MAKIGLFSGSFNPVHLGHVHLAEYLLEQTDIQELWLVVSPCNPLKQSTELLDQGLRLRMVELAIEHNPRLRASDFEFDMPQPSYTIDTLEALAAHYPEHEFSLIIGEDNWLLFHKWKDYKRILEDFSIIVYPRNSSAELFLSNALAYLRQLDVPVSMQGQYFIDAPLFPISSTEIRSLLAQKKSATQYLNPSVAQYIATLSLYE